MKNLSVVILAAGEGTRMKSETPKVLHALAGKPLVRWVLAAVDGLKPDRIYMIVGHKSDQLRESLKDTKVVFVEQKQRLGSGHALNQAAKYLKNYKGDILVLCADTPLISSAALGSLLKVHRKEKNTATVLSAEVERPFGYGRIVRLPSGQVEGIVEEKDADPLQKAIKEINSGIYCFQSPALWKALSKVTPDNAKKEYYLTDVLAIFNRQSLKVNASSLVCPDEILGVNSRAELAIAERLVREKVLRNWMLNGVTIVDPGTTYISPDAVIGNDTIIYPGSWIEGKSVIGSRCIVGPYSFLKESAIGNGVEIRFSYITNARVEDNVKIGPFAHLRPGAVMKTGSRIGNFSEVKNSVIGEGSKVNHLSYIGDATLGRDVNVGAGTITCNYDGIRKNKTVIGDHTFIGSNVNLVAPVNVGSDVLLGAGSTITDDVPSDALAIARARQVIKPGRKLVKK
jgi:bifunctional UDP-N-acetylglucosamine pyrophosphorylase/glucosamine-1-phosphate N-acetyltransferase